ncbi:hypothetical protein MYP_2678 [Sporocytophaga myxococcoides]|uniref:Alginate export domain-containing protein n=1 Tax=Sporocytophaga myxococcoides TaxID=153721 RepID=A0A098LG61_9BACT|nr:alginate export family protein [Sporocytophaga myxococcoides]GAL85449.1 hypothetical protein MYP_2678 [Sporocytophaga myxococcoides]
MSTFKNVIRLIALAPKGFIFILILLSTFVSKAQDSTLVQKDTTAKKTEEQKSYYVEAGSYGTKRDPTPPEYARQFNKTGITGVEKISWLDVGLDNRVRFEYRQYDIRRPFLTTDYPILFRTRAYVGIKEVLDPFRFAVEMSDAFRVHSKFPRDNRDFNRVEPISLYAELHFKKALGKDPYGNNRPAFVRFGRQNFEFLDRRLIGSNQWRNTTNTFTGFRAALGQDKNDWQIDLLALKPLVRLMTELDTADHQTQFGAAIFHWRKWSRIITIEPYLLYLRQKPNSQDTIRDRRIYNIGTRVYGWLTKEINYDVTYNQQLGTDNNKKQRAYAITAEIGYKFQYGWKPRFSLFYGYASGDRNPNDDVNNRFERFYGFARPWSADDYIVMENIIAPKARVEFEPGKKLKVDFSYSFYWLASRTDRFNNLFNVPTNPDAPNRDKTGQSGVYLGHGPDGRIRFEVLKFIKTAIGYSHYFNGTFVKNRQEVAYNNSTLGSNFFYIETMVNFFDIFKKW